ncbi:hypothetical protein ACT29H_03750 [Thermophagus sp. OGC60D27]|uniref:hypothetical protein n=1 Tax=Thermophagus sp. OGC60D27 TaxID=3458415 RepID=UPI004037AABB
MNCKEFNNRLASIKEVDHLTREMRDHIDVCASCKEMHAKLLNLFKTVLEEKSEKVSPFINTRILGEIKSSEQRVWQTKTSLISVMSVFFIMLGFLSARKISAPKMITTDPIETIASEYYLSDNPGSQLEKIWLSTYSFE